MHARISKLLFRSQQESSQFREVLEIEFYRLIYSALLIQLIFPNDNALINGFTIEQETYAKSLVYDLAIRYLKK